MAQRQFRSDDTSKWMEGFGNGLDGDLTISSNTTEAPIDSSCSGTAGSYSLTATNASFAAGQLILIHKTRGNTTVTAGSWELNKISSYVAGTITTTYPLIYSYNDSGADQSQVRVMKQYNNVTINNGITYTSKSWDKNVGGIMAFFAKGTVSGVTGGVINLNGNNANADGSGASGGASTVGIGFQGGNGYQGQAQAQAGEGTAGDLVQQLGANGNGGGGSKANTGTNAGGAGAAGGNGTAGANGKSTSGNGGSYGTGGSAVGSASLVTMVFGGGGGGGGNGATEGNGANGGGSGAGIALIISNNIDLSGLTINSKGGTGSTGFRGGGGGAGGSVLLKCKTATLGTNKIVATGGNAGGNSTAGGDGRIHIDYKTSYTGTTNPTLDATNDTQLDYPSSGGKFLYNFV